MTELESTTLEQPDTEISTAWMANHKPTISNPIEAWVTGEGVYVHAEDTNVKESALSQMSKALDEIRQIYETEGSSGVEKVIKSR